VPLLTPSRRKRKPVSLLSSEAARSRFAPMR
jgi:hypothetical protein